MARDTVIKCLQCGEPGVQQHLGANRKYCSSFCRQKYWRVKNKNVDKCRQREYLLKSKYGVTLKQYDALFAKQNGECAICGSKVSSKRIKNLHIDHCHDTGEIRGLLCAACNRGLGMFKDSYDLIFKALRYLDGTLDSIDS